MFYLCHNDWDEAADVAKKTVAIHEKSGDKGALSAALGNLGSIFMEKQDYDRISRESYARSIELKEELKDQKGLRELYTVVI